VRDINLFLNSINQWVSDRDDILAVALVGSFARGTARDDSDIDLTLICESPQRYLDDEKWLYKFGEIRHISHEDWGLLQSKRVFYENGLEVEFGLTSPAWAAINPVDAGTRRVIADGAQILRDPHGMLAQLIEAVKA
jgi:predicted nucleotidyltransferase